MKTMTLVWMALALLLTAGPVAAHELQGNRVTVVVRDRHSVELVLRLDLVGVLQHQMAPTAQPQEFLVAVVAQGPTVLEPALQQLRQQIEQGVVLKSRGAVLHPQHWRWPAAVELHALLREQLMAGVVAGDAGADVPSLEIHADAADALAIERLTLALPDVVKPAVIVWYRPQQALMGTQDHEIGLEF